MYIGPRYFDTVIAGMTQAHAAGRDLWREPPVLGTEPPSAVPGAANVAPVPPVYVLIDSACASACLDAADLWLALGAVQVGQQTSADTLNMDVREDILPSGMSGVAVPMTVYRGRSRGANTPLPAHFVYPGDMHDTAALATWIAALPRTGA